MMVWGRTMTQNALPQHCILGPFMQIDQAAQTRSRVAIIVAGGRAQSAAAAGQPAGPRAADGGHLVKRTSNTRFWVLCWGQ